MQSRIPRRGDVLTWAGTFHAIGARLLREYAATIGLDARFHDPRPRGLGGPDESRAARSRLLANGQALSDQGHLPRDLFARGQRASSRWRRSSSSTFPGAQMWEKNCSALFAAYVESQAAAARARLRRPAALLGADDGARPRSRPISRRASTTCWSTNTRTPTGCRPRSCWR